MNAAEGLCQFVHTHICKYLYIYVYMCMYVCIYICIYPPDPSNDAKILRAGSTKMPLGSWYLNGTKHCRPTIVVGEK